MVGGWIKFRADLLKSPKLIAVARLLHEEREFREWLIPGGSGPVNGQIISDEGLRRVTLASLNVTWSACRAFGKPWPDEDGNDCFVPFIGIANIDEMSGTPFIGEAMEHVGWAIEHDDPPGVILPNFFDEFNVPLTDAERSKAYRERQKVKKSVTESSRKSRDEKGEIVTPRVEKSGLDSTRLDRDRCADLPEEEIRRIVQHISKTVPIGQRTYRQDVRRLAQAAMLQLLGVLSEDDIEAMLERIRQRKIKRPGAYFTGCLKKQLAAVGYDWETLFDAVNPPATILNGKPAEGDQA